MSVCCVLSGRGLCDELITRPEESYRLWCVVMCDLENQTSWMRRQNPVGVITPREKKKTCGHCCRGWFLRFLLKKFNIKMRNILNGYGVVVAYHIVVNALPWTVPRKAHYATLESAGKETASESCFSQLALFTTERQRDFRPGLAFSKTCLKHMSV
jgi:hypothetical protein